MEFFSSPRLNISWDKNYLQLGFSSCAQLHFQGAQVLGGTLADGKKSKLVQAFLSWMPIPAVVIASTAASWEPQEQLKPINYYWRHWRQDWR